MSILINRLEQMTISVLNIKNMIKFLKIKCNQDSKLNLFFIEQIQFCKNFLMDINEPSGKK